jgi:phage tail sheath gpL-like
MSNLTSIADRLTPSNPMEVTFGADPAATGRKYTTIFAHRASTGGNANNYDVLTVVNVADPDKAKAEVDGFCGAGSQAGLMAAAFVRANLKRSNFPAFRVVVLPNAETGFGPSDEAIAAVKLIRSDMFVSPYPASNATAKTKLDALCALLSGPDRDLNGQFGSFWVSGSLDVYTTALALNVNSLYAIVAWLQDTNTALVEDVDCDTSTGSDTLLNVASTIGVNLGALASGTGIAAGSVVIAKTKTTIQLSKPATATGAAVDVDFQNKVSQSEAEVAADHAAAMIGSAFPYAPLQNVASGLTAPQKDADKVVIDPNGLSEQALTAGLSPLATNADGTVRFIRTRVTYATLPGNIARKSYIDWQDIALMYDFREVCYQIAQNPPFNNNPGGTRMTAQIVALFKDEVLRAAMNYEDQGAFQNVKVTAKKFVVQASTTSRGRLDFKIPLEVVPGLFVIAGNLVGVSDVANFTI